MMMRRLCTSLLLVVLALSGATRVPAAQRDGEDLAITPEEEREARALVEEFNKKLNETHDIAPLITEYFVADFTARLRQHAQTFPFDLVEWKDATPPPDADDLRRFYVVSTNLIHMLVPLYETAVAGRAKTDDEKDLRLADWLPPAAVKLIKSDPLLRDAIDDDDDERAQTKTTNEAKGGACAEDCAGSKADEAHMIENAEQLHHYTALAEEVSKIVRAHMAAQPVAAEKKEAGAAKEEDVADGDEQGRLAPEKVEVLKDARVLKDEFYGYPAGTRLVCANAGVLHVELVRVDGRLRILTAYLLIED